MDTANVHIHIEAQYSALDKSEVLSFAANGGHQVGSHLMPKNKNKNKNKKQITHWIPKKKKTNKKIHGS